MDYPEMPARYGEIVMFFTIYFFLFIAVIYNLFLENWLFRKRMERHNRKIEKQRQKMRIDNENRPPNK
jgi:predicted Holliday junction resolvase-like endonuclease